MLARIQQFLPQLEQSNAELLHRDPQSIDMEHIEETDERVIQMASKKAKTSLALSTKKKKNFFQNLGLGVFEQRRAGREDSASSGKDMTSESDSDSDSSTSSSSSSTSSSSTGSDSEDDDDDDARDTQREIRPLPKRARPLIQELHSVDEGNSPTS